MTDSFRSAATKILQAAEPCVARYECPGLEAALAAAIRELKNQVAPHRPIPQCFAEWGEYNMTEVIRERLDAIATELENAQ